MSSVAALPEDQRADTFAQIGANVSAGETPVELPVHALIGLTALAGAPPPSTISEMRPVAPPSS